MLDEMKKVSVIVPIYKVERYIEKCVTSLTNQDYQNIEIILVDDGSPDSSADIIDRLALHDGRIKVIHKENGGVSSARNAGIEAATGDYIMFVDGDDWVEQDYASYFLHAVKSSGCPIGMNTNNFYAGSGQTKDRIYTIDAEKAIEWIYIGRLFVAVWNKIYSAKLLKEKAVCFNNEIWYGEGMLFNIEALQFCDEVAICEKSVYHQTVNPNSAMRSFNLNSNFCGIRSMELQRTKWKKVNARIEKVWKYHRYCFNRSIIDGLVRSDMVNNNKAVFDECRQDIRRNIKIPLTADISPKNKLTWIGYYIRPTLIAEMSAKKFRLTVKKWGYNGLWNLRYAPEKFRRQSEKQFRARSVNQYLINPAFDLNNSCSQSAALLMGGAA